MSYSMAVTSCELWKKNTIQVALNCANKKRAKEQAASPVHAPAATKREAQNHLSRVRVARACWIGCTKR